MRLIDADALAASLGITNMDCIKCGWYNGLGCKRGSDFVAACEAIEDAPTIDTDLSTYSDKLWKMAYERGKAEAQRWIPVSEKLPDDGRTVLVTDWGETDFGKRHDGRWWNCDGDVLKDVSAWQPLPEPYKDGN